MGVFQLLLVLAVDLEFYLVFLLLELECPLAFWAAIHDRLLAAHIGLAQLADG